MKAEYHDPTGRACALAGRKAAGWDAPGYCEACYLDAIRSRFAEPEWRRRATANNLPSKEYTRA